MGQNRKVWLAEFDVLVYDDKCITFFEEKPNITQQFNNYQLTKRQLVLRKHQLPKF